MHACLNTINTKLFRTYTLHLIKLCSNQTHFVFRDAPGSNLNMVMTEENGDRMFQGTKLFHEEGDRTSRLHGGDASYKASRRKLLEGLQKSFFKRFEDVEGAVLQATSIVSFSTWPEKQNTKAEGT